MMDWLLAHVIRHSVIVGIFLGAWYLFESLGNPKLSDADVLLKAVTLVLSGATAASSIVMTIAAGAKSDVWFGNLAQFRLNIALGCFVAAATAIFLIYKIFQSIP